jgi:ribulose bisphosphate carboxylase small subunit
MVERRTWEEFRSIGLLWFINRILHLFGWAICFEYDPDKKLIEVYPSRCKFRGFDTKTEAKGFIELSKYLKENIEVIEKEANE